MSTTCPIWLVVGFLGAGKTTLLRRLVKTTCGRSLVYVVNEFSAVDVDAALIEREGGKTLAVPGGSIFCRCLVTEFVSVLRRVADGIPGTDGTVFQPEGVVIEASGIADPRSMRRLLSESRLDTLYHVAGVTAVVDPGTLMKLLLVLPNIRGQIEAADLVLLNKTDLHSPETIAKVVGKIRAINSGAHLLRCQYGEVDPSIILADGASQRMEHVDAAFGLCKDPRFEREAVVFHHPVDLQALCDEVTSAGEGLYRAKGFVRTTRGWKVVDWGSGVLSLEDSEPGPLSALTLIWNPATVKAGLSKRISRCEREPQ